MNTDYLKRSPWRVGIFALLLFLGGLWYARAHWGGPMLFGHKKTLSSKNFAKLTEVVQWKTDTGVSVYFLPRPEFGGVDIRIAIGAGTARDGQLPGRSTLVAGLLDEGTQDWSADELAEKIDALGLNYRTSSQREMMVTRVRALADPAVLKEAGVLLSSMLSKPLFAEKSINLVKQQCLLEVQQDEQMPARVAQFAFLKTLYPGHPYSTPPCGTRDSINAIQAADLKAFHAQYMVANNVFVTIVGGITEKQAKTLANDITANLRAGAEPAPIPSIPKLAATEQKIPLHTEQAHVMWGQPCLVINDPNDAPLQIGSRVLGGPTLVSRLFQAVRVQNGLAYQVNSYLQALSQPGPCLIKLQTQAPQADKAVSIMKDTVKQFVQEGPTEAELSGAKQGYMTSIIDAFSSNESIADTINQLHFYHLPLDFIQDQVEQVKSLTPEQVRSAFQRRLDLNNMALVVVGGISDTKDMTTKGATSTTPLPPPLSNDTKDRAP